MRRAFGTTGLTVSPISLGSWHTWDRAVFEEAVALLRLAIDRGLDTFDLAVYRSKGLNSADPYDSPTDIIFSRMVQEAGLSRDQYRLSVKGWMPNKPGAITLTQQVEQALRRHGTDHADLVMLGDVMVPPSSWHLVLNEVESLLSRGLVAHWGVSNWSADEIGRLYDDAVAAGIQPPVGAQLKYSIYRRSVAAGEPMRTLLARTGMGIQASDVFEGGLLFGTTTSRIIAMDVGGIQQHIVDMRESLAAVARQLDTSVARLGIAYPLADPRTATVLVGARTVAQLEDNLGAVALLESVGAEQITQLLDPLWADQHVDAGASWSAVPQDDPSHYFNTAR
jgi:L-glyceraldehyde 3-phosphate reductase